MRAKRVGSTVLGLATGLVAWVALRTLAAALEPQLEEGLLRVTPGARSVVEAPRPWSPPGEGFVVWESNRTGRWRLWIRDLDRNPARQLTPEEGSRAHCCPHVSPDGRWIAYLSLDPGPERYPEGPEEGILRLIDRHGREAPAISIRSRTYGEHRAAVWRSTRGLAFLDAEGRTAELDIDTGSTRILLPTPNPNFGFLPSPDLRFATAGRPGFSAVRPDGTLSATRTFGGCQPYFSDDSRWGYWTSGAGGPIDRIELANGQVGTILEKHDARLPTGQGYLYFPMLSPGGRMIAVGASRDEHSHYAGDYDIFVGEIDPARLEVLGSLVRFTDDPATDRFPAVYLAPLPLGVHDGEAPFRVTLEAPGVETAWRWVLGDGETAKGRRVEHVWQAPGSYRVVARRADEVLVGRIRVAPRRPPQVLGVELREGVIEVSFDEPVAIEQLSASLGSGVELTDVRVDDGGRRLLLRAAGTLADEDVLFLEGITDRGPAPAVLKRQEVQLTPRSWPSDRRGLLFLWEDGEADNQVRSVDGVEHGFPVEPRGAARFDRWWRMLLDRGAFEADPATAVAVASGARARNGVSLEIVARPHQPRQQAALVALGGSRGRRRLWVLEQSGDRLQLVFVSARSGPQVNVVDLGQLAIDRSTHWVVSYRPGLLTAYRDGEELLRTADVQGDLFHWRGRALTFGQEAEGEPWAGSLEGIALYDRPLEPGEVLENARRFRRRLERRGELPVEVSAGRLLARSHTPDLAEISPYSVALSVFELQRAVSSGEPSELVRVALYTMLDGRPTTHARRQVGSAMSLQLQPFDLQPQLVGMVLIDDLPPRSDQPLYFDVGPP